MGYNYDNIVISGLPASGKSTLVEGLLRKLDGWKFHSIGDAMKKRYEASGTKYPFSIWWDALPKEEQIKPNEELFEMIQAGNVIADTRYAILCKDGNILYEKTGKEKYHNVNLNALLVFVEAPFDIRVGRVRYRKDYRTKPLEMVVEELKRREEKELKIGREIFGINYQNKKDYDLILDSGFMTPEEEVYSVMNKMQNAS